MTMTSLTFTVTGTPRPQPRPRKVRGRWVSTANPRAQLWRDGVERVCRAALQNYGAPLPLYPKGQAVMVSMTFMFAAGTATDRIGRPHTHKPDRDNLEKLVLDVMERCGVYRNDSQVSRGPIEKIWSVKPGVVVTVEPDQVTPQLPDRDALAGGAPSWLG